MSADPLWDRLTRLADGEARRLRDALPPALRERFDTVTLFLEKEPAAFLVEEGVSADTLGLFEGPAFAEESDLELPARMTLFLFVIWAAADRRERAFKQEVRTTLLHELGHYLGLNEDELTDRELG
ncbi:MAG: metallopeptidase family protein [Kiritimatiellia bacterium]